MEQANSPSNSKESISNEEEQETSLNPDNYVFVVALDFGTTYSGYAFNARDDYQKDPLQIQTNQTWNAGGAALLSLKTPTSILLKKDGSFLAFGYEAEDKFYSDMGKGDRETVMLFRRFKMKLHNKTGINENLKIEDVAGRKYPAKTIISLFIRALADHLKLELKKQKTMETIKRGDIRWVLTVPAIWSDSAKAYMRKCAVEAGLPDEMLRIALEPEAASIYVQFLPIEREHHGFAMTKTGTKYMVVDIGGGTVDITVHEKIEGGELRELHQATGGACGGTYVDKEFENRLTEILGQRVMNKLREERTETYLDIFRDFEIAKRNINSCNTIRMTIPHATLNELCEEIEQKKLEKAFANIDGMTIKKDKLHIDAKIMRQFFQPTLKEIIKKMQSMVNDQRTDGISIILLVGGSANCELIQEEIRTSFTSLKLVVPPEPELAVMKGAVIFGHCPSLIISRILRFTYGNNVCEKFNPETHSEEKKITINGQDLCNDCFSTILTAGTEVQIGHTEIREYSPASKMQFGALVQIYCSPKEDVKYTDDEECFELGKLFLPLQRNFLAHLLSFPFSVAYSFGDTELKIRATDLATGLQTSCTLVMNE